MEQITITLPDGAERRTDRGTTVQAFAAAQLPAGVVRRALAAKVEPNDTVFIFARAQVFLPR